MAIHQRAIEDGSDFLVTRMCPAGKRSVRRVFDMHFRCARSLHVLVGRHSGSACCSALVALACCHGDAGQTRTLQVSITMKFSHTGFAGSWPVLPAMRELSCLPGTRCHAGRCPLSTCLNVPPSCCRPALPATRARSGSAAACGPAGPWPAYYFAELQPVAPAELRRMTRSQSAPTRSLDKARPCRGLVQHRVCRLHGCAITPEGPRGAQSARMCRWTPGPSGLLACQERVAGCHVLAHWLHACLGL